MSPICLTDAGERGVAAVRSGSPERHLKMRSAVAYGRLVEAVRDHGDVPPRDLAVFQLPRTLEHQEGEALDRTAIWSRTALLPTLTREGLLRELDAANATDRKVLRIQVTYADGGVMTLIRSEPDDPSTLVVHSYYPADRKKEGAKLAKLRSRSPLKLHRKPHQRAGLADREKYILRGMYPTSLTATPQSPPAIATADPDITLTALPPPEPLGRPPLSPLHGAGSASPSPGKHTPLHMRGGVVPSSASFSPAPEAGVSTECSPRFVVPDALRTKPPTTPLRANTAPASGTTAGVGVTRELIDSLNSSASSNGPSSHGMTSSCPSSQSNTDSAPSRPRSAQQQSPSPARQRLKALADRRCRAVSPLVVRPTHGVAPAWQGACYAAMRTGTPTLAQNATTTPRTAMWLKHAAQIVG
eukprot:TRINITY_DN7276_c0_g2_i1.p1 TRINITY_DN7276_c0_g2~~TRINITY_DN7276_c0_g2_i1.p1  ORF type:complete len:414 (+),score=65.16 TRINITY_DN7276_c0_g2_i1:42-1283(+)